MDIRDKRVIDPSDVVILYFDRSGDDVEIHPITIDECGNLIGVPSGYREFFLQEEKRFLLG
jgi:hypothetical protein